MASGWTRIGSKDAFGRSDGGSLRSPDRPPPYPHFFRAPGTAPQGIIQGRDAGPAAGKGLYQGSHWPGEHGYAGCYA